MGKPEWMISSEKEINSEEFRKMGDWFKEHLGNISNMLDKLQKNGWEIDMGLYDLFCYHDNINTEKEAKIELKKLGLNPKDFSIDEFEDEE